MLIELLQSKGYAVQEAPQGRYMKGLVPLLGGQFKLDQLQSDYIIRLFSNAQIRKGRAYTLKQLAQIALPDTATPQFTDQLARLTKQGAFIRGYRLQCPTCDLDTWYALDDVAEHVTCQGCRIPFQLPMEIDFAFRPNRLIMEATKSGALTVLLTLFNWLNDSPITLWLAGLEISKDGQKTDIDLIAQREDGVFMAECKDNFDPADNESIMNQLALGKSIAKSIGATYCFSTLNPDEIPQEIQEFCKTNQIVILSRSNLLHS